MSYAKFLHIFDEVVEYQETKKSDIHLLSKLFSSYRKNIEQFTSGLLRTLTTFKQEKNLGIENSTLEKGLTSLLNHIQTLSESFSSLSRNMQIDIIEPLDLFQENYSSMLSDLSKEGQIISKQFKTSHDNTIRVRAEYYHFSCEAEKAARLAITENSKEKQEIAEKIEQKYASKSEVQLDKYLENLLKTNEILETYEREIPPILMNLQQNEESRIQFLKNSLEKYSRYFRKSELNFQESLEKLSKSCAEISPSEDISLFLSGKSNEKLIKREDFVNYEDWKRSLNENEYEIMEKEPDISVILKNMLTGNLSKVKVSIFQELADLVSFSEGRRIFIELLEGSEQKVIRQENLELLAKFIRSMMDQIVTKKEYDAFLFCKIVEISTKFSSEPEKTSLSSLLSGHQYWTEKTRWTQAIDYAMNSKMLLIQKSSKKDPSTGDNVEKIESSSAYIIISQFVFQLSKLEVPLGLVQELIQESCNDYEISKEKACLLLIEMHSRAKNSYKKTRKSCKKLSRAEFVLIHVMKFLKTFDLFEIGYLNKKINERIFQLVNKRNYRLRRQFFMTNNTMRRKLWLDCLHVSSLKHLNYPHFVEEFNENKSKLTEICRIIDMDIARSYHKVKEINSDVLKNILKTFANYQPLIGYCQGMNYIAGTLLFVIRDEDLTFKALVSLINNFKMGSLFDEKLTKLKKLFFILDRLVSVFLPKLNQTFQDSWIFCGNFSSGWFIALFGGVFMTRFEVLLQIWDLFLLEGWKGLFKVCIGIIGKFERQLVGESLENILSVLSTVASSDIFDASFFSEVSKIKISSSLIESITLEYKSLHHKF
jgi:hypothetical protein